LENGFDEMIHELLINGDITNSFKKQIKVFGKFLLTYWEGRFDAKNKYYYTIYLNEGETFYLNKHKKNFTINVVDPNIYPFSRPYTPEYVEDNIDQIYKYLGCNTEEGFIKELKSVFYKLL